MTTQVSWASKGTVNGWFSAAPHTYRIFLWGPEALFQAGIQALGPPVDELHGVSAFHVVDDWGQRGLVNPERSRLATEDGARDIPTSSSLSGTTPIRESHLHGGGASAQGMGAAAGRRALPYFSGRGCGCPRASPGPAG